MSPPAHLGHTIHTQKKTPKQKYSTRNFVYDIVPSSLPFSHTGIGDPSPDALKDKPPHHSVLQVMTYGFAFMLGAMDTA